MFWTKLWKTQELAAAYVSTRGPCSIISDEVLDFQVRNGTGYFHFSITTSNMSNQHIIKNIFITHIKWVIKINVKVFSQFTIK